MTDIRRVHHIENKNSQNLQLLGPFRFPKHNFRFRRDIAPFFLNRFRAAKKQPAVRKIRHLRWMGVFHQSTASLLPRDRQFWHFRRYKAFWWLYVGKWRRASMKLIPPEQYFARARDNSNLRLGYFTPSLRNTRREELFYQPSFDRDLFRKFRSFRSKDSWLKLRMLGRRVYIPRMYKVVYGAARSWLFRAYSKWPHGYWNPLKYRIEVPKRFWYGPYGSHLVSLIRQWFRPILSAIRFEATVVPRVLAYVSFRPVLYAFRLLQFILKSVWPHIRSAWFWSRFVVLHPILLASFVYFWYFEFYPKITWDRIREVMFNVYLSFFMIFADIVFLFYTPLLDYAGPTVRRYFSEWITFRLFRLDCYTPLLPGDSDGCYLERNSAFWREVSDIMRENADVEQDHTLKSQWSALSNVSLKLSEYPITSTTDALFLSGVAFKQYVTRRSLDRHKLNTDSLRLFPVSLRRFRLPAVHRSNLYISSYISDRRRNRRWHYPAMWKGTLLSNQPGELSHARKVAVREATKYKMGYMDRQQYTTPYQKKLPYFMDLRLWGDINPVFDIKLLYYEYNFLNKPGDDYLCFSLFRVNPYWPKRVPGTGKVSKHFRRSVEMKTTTSVKQSELVTMKVNQVFQFFLLKLIFVYWDYLYYYHTVVMSDFRDMRIHHKWGCLLWEGRYGSGYWTWKRYLPRLHQYFIRDTDLVPTTQILIKKPMWTYWYLPMRWVITIWHTDIQHNEFWFDMMEEDREYTWRLIWLIIDEYKFNWFSESSGYYQLAWIFWFGIGFYYLSLWDLFWLTVWFTVLVNQRRGNLDGFFLLIHLTIKDLRIETANSLSVNWGKCVTFVKHKFPQWTAERFRWLLLSSFFESLFVYYTYSHYLNYINV